MVECNCAGYGLSKDPAEVFHAHRCAITQYLLALTEGGDRYYVDIPLHKQQYSWCTEEQLETRRVGMPWPTLELAQGAMHRLLGSYPETPILLYRNDVVIDMKSLADPGKYYWLKLDQGLYDWKTGELINS